jgi:radical SAM superfamily enzyme YgiQ (UPF0313 family)
MAKVLFIQDVLFEYQGIEALSAYLKAKGHGVSLLVLNETGPDRIVAEVKKAAPDILAFSVTSNNYEWSVALARRIKEALPVLSVFGGPHPTCFPDFISTGGVDVICRGDGEEALAELCSALDRKEAIGGIRNLWVKDAAGEVRRNELRPLTEDPDVLPFCDRKIYYDNFPLLRGLSNKRFLVQRGCPYSCSFCFNNSLRDMYKGLGKFVRFRSPRNIVDEILAVGAAYPLRSVSFNADSFTLHPQFLEFMELYKKEVALPFFCNARFNELTEEKIIKLKEAGCIYLAIGVESGSARIRNEVLHRGMSDEVIIGNSRLLKKHGLPFNSYIMMGVPTETLDDAFRTLEFLAAIGSDKIMPSVYRPLFGTGLWNFMEQRGLFEDGAAGGLEPGVKLEHKRELLNLYKLSYVAVRFPRLMPLIKKLIKLPDNPVFRLLFYYGTFDAARVSRNMSFLELLRLGWKLRKTMQFKHVEDPERLKAKG